MCILLGLSGHLSHPKQEMSMRGLMSGEVGFQLSPQLIFFLPQEGPVLGNISSLHAIVSALQNFLLHHMKKMWGHVPW